MQLIRRPPGQHELDHTDHTDHTDHADHTDHTDHADHTAWLIQTMKRE